MFNERKAAQAAAWFLRQQGGRMPHLKLVKLMYLADRQSLDEHGFPITGVLAVSMPHGPVLSMTLNVVKCHVAAGADAIVVTPGLGTEDLIARIAQVADRPVIASFTADEHALYTGAELLADPRDSERESLVSARRAGAELVITYGARDAIAA